MNHDEWLEALLDAWDELSGMNMYFENVNFAEDPDGDTITANEAMVDDADIVIALYPFDMDWKTMSGGTANCMRYAHRNHKPIQQIDPFTKQIRWI